MKGKDKSEDEIYNFTLYQNRYIQQLFTNKSDELKYFSQDEISYLRNYYTIEL